MTSSHCQHSPPAIDVRGGPGESPEDRAGGEARDVEQRDGGVRVAVPGVQPVDVGALQPVREHGQQVHREVGPLQAATRHMTP